jgi:hypothetical protein
VQGVVRRQGKRSSLRSSPPRTANRLPLCAPSARQISQIANRRVVLNDLFQSDRHCIRNRRLLQTGVKLPCAVLIVMGNTQNRLTPTQHVCGREDDNIRRICERPITSQPWIFHETRRVGGRSGCGAPDCWLRNEGWAQTGFASRKGLSTGLVTPG